MSYLALDIGERKIGLAKTDQLLIGIWPLPILLRENIEKDFESLFQIIQENQIEKIIVGSPYHIDGRESEQGKKIKKFMRSFSKFLQEKNRIVPVEWTDERLTSWEASDRLKGMKKKEKKKKLDSIAACLILESYLSLQPSLQNEE